jgi:hypothetical protein
MAHRLDSLEPGTPVLCDGRRVGEVRGVYAEGSSAVPEYLSVYWDARREEILIATNDVATLESQGVILVGDPRSYADSAMFVPSHLPTIRRIH